MSLQRGQCIHVCKWLGEVSWCSLHVVVQSVACVSWTGCVLSWDDMHGKQIHSHRMAGDKEAENRAPPGHSWQTYMYNVHHKIFSEMGADDII